LQFVPASNVRSEELLSYLADVESRLEAAIQRKRSIDIGETQTESPARVRIGDRLVARGLVSPTDLEQALALQKTRGLRLGEMLVEMGTVSSGEFARVLAEHLRVQHVDLAATQPDPLLTSLIPESFARRYHALPIERHGEYVVVAMADPADILATDDLTVLLGCEIVKAVADPEQLEAVIERVYATGTIESNIHDAADDLDVADQVPADDVFVDDGPMVRLVNAMLEQAVADGASDIHVEPGPATVRIRTRIDGVLHDRSEAPLSMLRSLMVRLKVLGGLDIAQHRVPQDGRFSVTVHGRAVDVRLATLPTAAGEAAVLRMLRPERSDVSFESVGLTAAEHDVLMPYLHARQGGIVVAGPTGAGKTTTLYAALQAINTRQNSIVSIEDPVEYVVDGVKQVQVNERAGMTFPTALRSLLRSDPDVILVGEIRDPETARIAASASITGHMVLSTVHTTSAAATPMRLLEMGVEPYLVASALTCVVSQRLVRTLCTKCARELVDPDLSLLVELGAPECFVDNAVVRTPVGCPACRQTGYQGRTAVFEVMPVSEEIRRMIVERAHRSDIERAAVEQGMETFRIAALRRVANGQLSIDEMLRVFG
jgi:type IV pilus assembly protein PilB